MDATLEVEVGAAEGQAEYLFQDISSARRLSNGNLVVGDRGTSEVSIYDASGVHVRTIGRSGSGPGEFRNVAGLYVVPGDSILVADGFSERASVFASDGTFVRSLSFSDLASDPVFGLGTWIFGRYLVQAGLGSTERNRINGILAQRPHPPGTPGYREAIGSGEDLVWIQAPDASEGNTWLGLDHNAHLAAWVDLPEDFEPLAFRRRSVLGRAHNSLDVQSLRVYSLREGTTTRPEPDWLSQRGGVSEASSPELWDPTSLTEHVRMLASSQEVYYSTHLSYSSSPDSLEWTTDVVDIDFVQADARGWIGIFSTQTSPTMCAMAYGFTIPPGWRMGQLHCGDSNGS